ncbi:MAG TPA: NlpC/P60 family protein [Verrucomicrobia bacterium]|nr:NlpC/P60 family protein [Verrucomicrobiota bacterium]
MPIPVSRYISIALLLASLVWLNGCATPPPADPQAMARQRILATAERLVGTPYILGGESPVGVDCSGLVQYAYQQAGIRVPRTTAQQFQAGRPQRKVLPGDLLFFRTDYSGTVSHVGIYTGHGQMIHASSGSRQVRKVKLNQRYWQQRMVGGVTFLGVRPSATPMASESWLRPNG